jgi:glycosyltransferase involved in cell wall biosynthesis
MERLVVSPMPRPADGRPQVWLLGGMDMHLRIPFVLRLERHGFKVAVVSSGDPSPFARHGIEHHGYALHRLIDPLADLRSLREVARLIREHRPDLVHGFDTKPSLLAPLACARAGIGKSVRTINGMGYIFSPGARMGLLLRPTYEILQRLVAPLAAATVFQNADDQAHFVRRGLVDPAQARLIRGSGIDLEAFAAAVPTAEVRRRLRRELAPGGELIVTTVSRLTREKGIDVLLEAAARVRSRRKDVVLVLVGPLASEGRLAVPAEAIAARGDDIRWLGPREDVPALLSVTDLFVLPTQYREGVPRVLLEAGAAGCPMVATRLPGCVDVVRDGWNGLVVEGGDAGALAEAIERLLDDPGLRAAMGTRSRQRIEAEFAIPRIVDAHAAVYREVLGLASPGALAA